MADALTHALADMLRQKAPALCATLDAAIQEGYRPEHIQQWVDQLAEQSSANPRDVSLIHAYLCDVDPDFSRAEEARAVGRWRND